jgi:hypothetical protein
MHATSVATICITLAASPLAAREISLIPPIDCDLGTDCFVQQYVDHDPSPAAMDFHCAPLSYDAHKGTDFALRSIAQMQAGVNVIAPAPGVVTGTRNGMRDEIFTAERVAEIDGRDCGNGVAVNHGDGWTAQYCHLKQGSVTVKTGDRLNRSDVIGQVGLSGKTQFPHVHMTLRKDGVVVDPFDPDGQITCGAPSSDSLWQTPLPYLPGGILSVGFADAVPEFNEIKAGRAATDTLPTDASALVVFGYAFGGQADDAINLQIVGPDGEFMSQTVTLAKNQAQFFRAIGKKHRTGWTPGVYTGTVSLIRGTQIVSTAQGSVTIR